MVTQKSAIRLVKDYVKAVRLRGVSVHKAILFGSYARNEQHQWSDIDVALVADNFIGIAVVDKTPFRYLHTIEKYVDIETHTFQTEWFEQGDLFINEIKKTGILIYEDTPQYSDLMAAE